MTRVFIEKFRAKGSEFWAGVALATPFIASLVPSPLLGISLLWCVPFGFFHLIGPRSRMLPLAAIVKVVLVICVMHIAAVIFVDSNYANLVLRDVVIAAAMLIFYTRGRTQAVSGEKMVSGFFSGLLVVAFFVAVLSIFKNYYLERKVFFPFLGDPYPLGTSFKRDYNIFGFAMLTAVAGMIGMIFSRESIRERRLSLICLVAVPPVLLAAAFSGSRRTLILLPLLLVLLSSLYLKRRPIRPTVAVAVLLSLLGTFVMVSWFFTLGLTSRLAQTILSSSIFGFESRLARWHAAEELLKQSFYLKPSGFRYHEVFSCRFSECVDIDYPHFPPLSGWLIGGIVGLGLVLVVYFMQARNLVRMKKTGIGAAVFALALFALPHSLISGDTILSNPQFLSLALLALSLTDVTEAES